MRERDNYSDYPDNTQQKKVDKFSSHNSNLQGVDFAGKASELMYRPVDNHIVFGYSLEDKQGRKQFCKYDKSLELAVYYFADISGNLNLIRYMQNTGWRDYTGMKSIEYMDEIS